MAITKTFATTEQVTNLQNKKQNKLPKAMNNVIVYQHKRNSQEVGLMQSLITNMNLKYNDYWVDIPQYISQRESLLQATTYYYNTLADFATDMAKLLILLRWRNKILLSAIAKPRNSYTNQPQTTWLTQM